MTFFEKLLKTLLPFGLIVFLTLFVLASDEHPKIDKRRMMENRVRELRKNLEEIRGLKFKKTIQISYKDRGEMDSYVRELMQRESKSEVREGEMKALVEFGLLPEEIDLEKSLAAFYAKQALGFYDIERARLVLISDLLSDQDLLKNPNMAEANKVLYEYFGIDLVDFALLHELDHALIDQNFPLREFRKSGESNFDKSLCYRAFIEGEAILANHIFIFRPLGVEKEIVDGKFSVDNIIDQQSSLGFAYDISSLPRYITAVALFPYQNGLDFVTEIYLKGGWKEVNALYSYPPDSTEHILHPEKYIQKKDPPKVVLLAKMDSLIGPQWRVLDQNTLGEFRISLLISALLEKDDTSLIASEGWGGDQYILFEDDKQNRILHFKSVWDSERDAQEFYEAFIRGNQHQSFAEEGAQSEKGNEKTLKKDQIKIFMKISGDIVEIIRGPASQIDGIRAAFKKSQESGQSSQKSLIQQDLD
jgi:hypothetical protein